MSVPASANVGVAFVAAMLCSSPDMSARAHRDAADRSGYSNSWPELVIDKSWHERDDIVSMRIVAFNSLLQNIDEN